jgi:hypothetical protein
MESYVVRLIFIFTASKCSFFVPGVESLYCFFFVLLPFLTNERYVHLNIA